MPADIALITPCSWSSRGRWEEDEEKARTPMKIPRGVVSAKEAARVGLRTDMREGEWEEEEKEGRAAIRMPRERPSKSWWKRMAVTRVAVHTCG